MSIRIACFAAILAVPASALPASAQENCPGGRAWNGGCANAALVGAAGTTAYLRSLGRLSDSALPILPREEWLPGHPAGGLPRFGLPNRDRVIPPTLTP
ncbi:MAG: hypothetical protein O9322_13010 [Beijerinckiaceae bacterium]|nr:hypothetical protein [Beijerinckiaceae bacterium]MCZ8300262.1 hypothetical protein [Beijerinckiaceae bacterium]